MNAWVMEFARRALPMEGTVLEIGSLNVNGSLRKILPISLGIDIRKGKDVDRVLDACDLLDEFGPQSWDNVVSASTFEHVEHLDKALENAWAVLKTGGKWLFEVPTQGKGRHDYPSDYWRWTEEMLREMHAGNEIIHCGESWEYGVGMICVKRTERLAHVEPLKIK